MSPNKNSIHNINIIIQNPSSDGEFEIKKLEDLPRNSGTHERYYIDECVVNKSEIKQCLCSHNLSLIEIKKKLDSGSWIEAGDNINSYSKICEREDYLKVQYVKANANNGTIITNDYGMFTCATLEGVRSIYMPNNEQLKRGFQYFLHKKFLKKINHLKNLFKYENI